MAKLCKYVAASLNESVDSASLLNKWNHTHTDGARLKAAALHFNAILSATHELVFRINLTAHLALVIYFLKSPAIADCITGIF